ncbi:hypothetical protein HPP92_018717 [Vanilla planifolia]|uniref:WW domain-containing protein n=1 Tax=Vanilla planifolia TaxID=51239 RepID=A0A835UN54_VANPL|nr:hypothetical protein HPP92_019307 [Vanilla planifolia]KAG0469389.1 hypothetical protein HPP92_018717 [Vanilla planifolia]
MVSLKKRKRAEEDEETTEAEQFYQWETKPNKTQQSKSSDSFIDLNLDSPLPMEWQRCLDIKSGEMHFYNTWTQRRTLDDPRLSHESTFLSPNLDLELNLKCEPSGGRLTLDADDTTGEEMLATVCARCHLLVVMHRESPSCPNCKFLHPPGLQSLVVKPTLRPLCCRD